MQTGLKSDNFCGYNQAAAPFFWVFQPKQYENTYATGEIGVFAAGGTTGSYVRPEIIDVSSFLLGLDNIISKCTPPAPSLDSLNNPMVSEKPIQSDKPVQSMNSMKSGQSGQVTGQSGQVTYDAISKQDDLSYLLTPKYTKELRSVNSVDSVDYNRWAPNLPVEPQNLRFVIEDFANQRNGFNTRNYTKSAWSNQNNSPSYKPEMCQTTLNPNFCGKPEYEEITGYPGKNPITGEKKVSLYRGPEQNPNDYPFIGTTSRQIFDVGASACATQEFYGPNYDKGSCPVQTPQVMKKSWN